MRTSIFVGCMLVRLFGKHFEYNECSNVCKTLRGAFNYATVSRSTLEQYAFCWRHNESLLFSEAPELQTAVSKGN